MLSGGFFSVVRALSILHSLFVQARILYKKLYTMLIGVVTLTGVCFFSLSVRVFLFVIGSGIDSKRLDFPHLGEFFAWL